MINFESLNYEQKFRVLSIFDRRPIIKNIVQEKKQVAMSMYFIGIWDYHIITCKECKKKDVYYLFNTNQFCRYCK